MPWTRFALPLAALLLATTARADARPPQDRVGAPEPGEVTEVLAGLDVPWGVAFLPDGSALVTERNEFTVRRVTRTGESTDLGAVPGTQGTGGEDGVMGVEVSPTFDADGLVFLYHTAAGGNRVVRARLVDDRLTDWATVLDGIPKGRYHNGGRLRFSPDGRHLFVATGDVQDDRAAQDLDSAAGKVLRVHPDGSIPADNPFPGRAVYSYGHRNVQGLDFDVRGRLWAAELGNARQDEVNLIEPGGDYGWPDCEGTTGSCAGSVPPRKTWATWAASPSGLTAVGDHLFVAAMAGRRLYRLRVDERGELVEQRAFLRVDHGRLRTVEADPQGDLWLTTSADRDLVPGNDRLLHVDLVAGGGP